jgi:hypothetical protein
VQVVQDEVAVGHRVERVRRYRGEAQLLGDHRAVGVEAHAGQRPGPQRHDAGRRVRVLEALAIAQQHPGVGEQVVREVDRLGALEVGVARHRPVEVALGGVRQRAGERRRAVRGRRSRLAREERHVGGDLVVARARRVQASADRTDELGQPTLDRHVDVLVAGREREPVLGQLASDRVEPREQHVAVGLGDDAAGRQHPRVGARLRHVMAPQAAVELKRRVERPEGRVLGLGEAAH